MAILIKIVLFLHVCGFVLGLGAGWALVRISPFAASANAEQKSIFFKVVKLLGAHINLGLALLWITGLLMVGLKYQGVAGLSHWFWLKLVFVVVLSAAVGIGSKARRQMMAGDAGQAPKARMMGMIAGGSGLAAIFCAVFAFG